MKKFLYWTPRVLSILFAIFISIFALDVFDGGYGFPGVLVALFMHMIPTFLVIAIIIIAWKKPIWGGALFIGLAIAYTVMVGSRGHLSMSFILSGPLLLIGLLFLAPEFYRVITRK